MGTEDGPLRDADKTLLSAVDAMFEHLVLDPADRALRAVAAGYAEQIDNASAAGRSASRVLRRALADEVDAEVVELVQALQAKLAERTAWADLGPKLVAVLVELGATPKARAAIRKGGPTAAGSGKFAGLRQASEAG